MTKFSVEILGAFRVKWKSVLLSKGRASFPVPIVEPRYESEAKCNVFVMKIGFPSYANK